ncbi:DNA-binding transcriptional LysR family regulator [Rhizobium sp. SG_E_25_P2]|uniref:LysR family transcriptional regulator n=1 Tax=Rhizobium sp. SG_E_25_P2 TaxID=2879942 RepID=UPI0024772AD1|nr:LysR family transcriptional regulator [Rhizobium sp. SG_E_25_P2]MDH6266146.1 DNA-binding transcriptional LysR family regulator [Rhizobium sp. SG_E_25_P2]
MNLTIRQLRYVSEVARLGSVQAASKALNISQSSILAAISIAEAELGSKIFDRKPARGVVVTPSGERYIQAARVMLGAATEFGRAVGDLSGRVPRAIRIGCFEPFGALFMPEMLRVYLDEVGDQVDIVLQEGDQVQMKEWLASGEVDLVVLYDIGPDIIGSVTRICKVPAHAVINSDSPLASREALWISDLADHRLVLLDLPQTSTYLLTLFDVLATRPEVKFRTRSYETVRSAVASNLGMSILNMRPIGRATADGPAILRKPILDDLPPPTLIIADMYGSMKPLFLRVFIDVFRSFFQKLGPEKFAVTIKEKHKTLLL